MPGVSVGCKEERCKNQSRKQSNISWVLTFSFSWSPSTCAPQNIYANSLVLAPKPIRVLGQQNLQLAWPGAEGQDATQIQYGPRTLEYLPTAVTGNHRTCLHSLCRRLWTSPRCCAVQLSPCGSSATPTILQCWSLGVQGAWRAGSAPSPQTSSTWQRR